MDATPDLTLTGEHVLDEFGWSVASAGDDDAGRAYIYHGGPTMDGVTDVTLTGEADGDHFGSALSSAGDVNDDGYADVIVGASGSDLGAGDAGAAFILLRWARLGRHGRRDPDR